MVSRADVYLGQHKHALEAAFASAVNAVVEAQPPDPIAFLAKHLERQTQSPPAAPSPPAANPSPTPVKADPPPNRPAPPEVGEAPAEPPAPAIIQSEWTAADWLTSEGIHNTVSKALLGGACVDELEAMRALGRLDRLEGELGGRLVTAAGSLAKLLAPRLRQLAMTAEATSAELQAKFSQDTHGMLEYGSLSTFFGGLEGLVGTPSHSVMSTMGEEHTARPDSKLEILTSNYGLRTTSIIEWGFVATPGSPPAGGFPVEEKIRNARASVDGVGLSADLAALLSSGAQPRQPMPINEL